MVMMDSEKIEAIIRSNLPDCTVSVEGDGRHFEAKIISDVFEGLSLLARQRKVYSFLSTYIQQGTIHALSLATKTYHESKQEREYNNG